MDEPEDETHPPMNLQYRSDAMSQLGRVTCQLREDLENERGGRLDFLGNVQSLSSDPEKDRAEYTFS